MDYYQVVRHGWTTQALCDPMDFHRVRHHRPALVVVYSYSKNRGNGIRWTPEGSGTQCHSSTEDVSVVPMPGKLPSMPAAQGTPGGAG